METVQNIILYYKYIAIANPRAIERWQKRLCTNLNLKGRIIIATEGINGTLGGAAQNIDAYIGAMQEHELFQDIDFKISSATADHFPRLRIVVKKEIVNLGIDPASLKAENGGQHLSPADTHVLIEQKPDDLVILDCRNEFESRIGSFQDAIKPPVRHFRDFPAYVDATLPQFKDKQVLLFCTGGVRCERGSAYLKSKGVAREVYQLQGGIHRYIEQFPDGFFRGKNYVFDGRVTVAANQDIISACSLCSTPSDEYHNCLNAACNKQIYLL